MKKIIGGLGLCMVVLLLVGVFVAAADLEVVDGIAEEVQDYVEKFTNKKGIQAESIIDVTEVDFDDLPKEVNIENVGDHNLAIYQVDYNEGDEEKKVFVITYSVEELKAQGDLIIAHDKRQFLNFGFDGEMVGSGFLKTSTGVKTSLEKGYVMVREGSITAISTNLEAVEGVGEIKIIIYKNGEQIGFGNEIIVDSAGIKKDYDVQSNEVVTFEPGDVISVYISTDSGLVWEDVITMMEITTTN